MLSIIGDDAVLDAATGIDSVAVTPKVGVFHGGRPVARPTRGDEEVREHAFIDCMLQLFQSEEDLIYEQLAAKARALGLFIGYDER